MKRCVSKLTKSMTFSLLSILSHSLLFFGCCSVGCSFLIRILSIWIFQIFLSLIMISFRERWIIIGSCSTIREKFSAQFSTRISDNNHHWVPFYFRLLVTFFPLIIFYPFLNILPSLYITLICIIYCQYV